MRDALDPEPLLRALHEAHIDYVIIGGFAVNAHGVIRPSRDLDIVPRPSAENLCRLARLLAELEARQLGADDFASDEFPTDPTDPQALEAGANFRLQTRLGDLDVMQWIPGVDHEPAYDQLAANAISGELSGIPLRVSGLRDLIAMKRAAGRPRDLDDLRLLGADEAEVQG